MGKTGFILSSDEVVEEVLGSYDVVCLAFTIKNFSMVAEKLSMFLKALDREKAKAIFKVAMISPVEVKLVVFFSPARML